MPCSGSVGGSDGLLGKRFSLTLVQPITEPVEDDVLFARRHQADGAAAHRGAIVNVVLEDEDLKKRIERKEKRDNQSSKVASIFHENHKTCTFVFHKKHSDFVFVRRRETRGSEISD